MKPSFEDDLEERLSDWRASGLERHLRTLSGVGPVVSWEDRSYLNFCSNDYLGLAGDPRLTVSAASGSGASRLITGTLDSHQTLERELAEFVGKAASLVFSSGYAANVGTISALVQKGDHVFSDRLNHASLIDGARLSGAEIHVYEHSNWQDLQALLEGASQSQGRKLVVTDTLFSMDGDLAPLRELRAVCDQTGAGLYVDEAHALGVLGPEGSGACAAAGVDADVLVGTLGKSFGVAGAFVSGTQALRNWLIQRARSFVFSTAVSPLMVEAVRAALHVTREEKWRRTKVIEHADRIRAAMEVEGTGPIIPILFGSNEAALKASDHLRERGILAGAIRPPTVPEGQARIRLTPMATHQDEHVDQLLQALETCPS